MNATASANLNGKTDLPRHVEPSPGDLVGEAQRAADHDRARQKERRDAWLAAQHQIATILSGAAADCVAMERERIAAMGQCEQLLSAYAPGLARSVAALQPAAPAEEGAADSRMLVAILSTMEQHSRDERRRLCKPAPIYAVPTEPPVPPPSEPPLDPGPAPEPEPDSDPGPAQAPPDAENLLARRAGNVAALAGYDREPCPHCGEYRFVRSAGGYACEACGARSPDAQSVSATVCEGPVKTRLMHCPRCKETERVPAVRVANICGPCAMDGKTVELTEGPPPAARDAGTGTKAPPVKRPPVAKPKPGKPKGK